MTKTGTLFDDGPYVVADPETGIGAELGRAKATQRVFIDQELSDVAEEEWVREDTGWTASLPVVVCIAATSLATVEIELRGGTPPSDADEWHEEVIGRLNQEGADSPFVLDVDGPPFNDIVGYSPELVDAALERAVAIGHGLCEEVLTRGGQE
jgi:hypothetical protein